jgi:hypothetical protein
MRASLLLCLACSVGTAVAQEPTEPAPSAEAMQQQLLEAKAAAEAGATRPGDEDLSCEALQAEIVSLAQTMQQDPALQTMAAQAQADLAKIQEAQQAAETQQASRPRLGQMMRGMATGVVPGMDRANAAAQQAAAMAQAQQAQAQASQNLQRMAAMSQGAAALAGPAMRGQRVVELAQARNCAWLEEAGAAMPMPPAPPLPTQ